MFEKALQYDKAITSVILQHIQQLYAIERQDREDNLAPEQHHAVRLDKSLPILNQIGAFIADQRNKTLPRRQLGKALEYCSHRWDNLMNYRNDWNLEIDNNLIENSIRPLALGHKNYLFADSHAAAQDIAMYYSFFGICKQPDIHPQKRLAHVIRNINDTKSSKLKYPATTTYNLKMATGKI